MIFFTLAIDFMEHKGQLIAVAVLVTAIASTENIFVYIAVPPAVPSTVALNVATPVVVVAVPHHSIGLETAVIPL